MPDLIPSARPAFPPLAVYGDPQFRAEAGAAFDWLTSTIERVRLDHLDTARASLIQAGQLEQAIADHLGLTRSGFHALLLRRTQALTEAAAQTLLVVAFGPKPAFIRSLARLRRVLNQTRSAFNALPEPLGPALSGSSSAELTLKVPEGYEFYALFPEQYWAAARSWVAEHRGEAGPRAVVVGIRGIGTSLSAVVAVTLRAAGWRASRWTVRPTGHPFAREVTLPERRLARDAWALIIDEGPGISGSSMAATAQRLSLAGFHPSRISFLPGHPNGPGPAAAEGVQRWWSEVRQYVTSRDQLTWPESVSRGSVGSARPRLDLVHRLLRRVEELRFEHERIEEICEAGAGRWRAFAYSDEKEWPPVSIRFERPKYLCTRPDGTRVLWKFAGLGALVEAGFTSTELAIAHSTRLAEAGWVPKPLGFRDGFLAWPWIEGVRLKPGDADRAVIRHLGRYLVEAARSPLSPETTRASSDRLVRMVRHNVAVLFGEDEANRAAALAENIDRQHSVPSFGDGRLAPHEWVRMRSGQLIKTDHIGHSIDHTLVGGQSVLWDVAGVLVEWQLSPPERAQFIQSIQERAADLRWTELDWTPLRFYELAYATFRLSQTLLCQQFEPDESPEFHRLARAAAQYRDWMSGVRSGHHSVLPGR
jgi:hypothetical protein